MLAQRLPYGLEQHSVVYAGFSALALRERINHAEAKLVVTVDGFHRNGKVIKLKEVVDEAMRTPW